MTGTRTTRLCLTIGATLLAAARSDAQLTIRLTSVPASTPPNAVHVAGSFNRWAPDDARYVLARQADGSYAITLPDSVRGAVEFKFALGSWNMVETSGSGGDVANRSVTVPATGATTFTGTVAGWRSAAMPTPKQSTASRTVRVLSDSFAMPQLGRTRRVWVRLPVGYATSTKRYPVLYMHDGQNVFDAATSFAGEWGVDETLDSLEARGSRGAIVVAVDNGAHRMDEYDPWKSADSTLGGGEGDAYVDFLVRTLKPYVDAHFRTLPDAPHTAIAGSSMGGLISLYAALVRPDVFGRAGVFSCACWVAGPRIMALARQAKPTRPPARFYFVSGAFETKEGQPATEQRAVVDSLAAAGFRRGAAVRSVIAADGKHAEWFWRREFPAAYEWLMKE